MTEKTLPCPVCGFLVNSRGFYGTYDLCPICDWEDDGVQLANPCSEGGANGNSLAVEQAIWIARIPLDVMEHKGFLRSNTWRPLTTLEVQNYSAEKTIKHWSNIAALEEDEAYWRKS